MKPKANRTPLEKLREQIGFPQEKFAEILRWPFNTYRKIELGKLRMSKGRAMRVQEETGVSANYILRGDVTAPMNDRWGRSYTRATYTRARAEAKRRRAGLLKSWKLCQDTATLAVRVSAIMLRACKEHKADLCNLELSDRLERFEKKFPQDRKLCATFSKGKFLPMGNFDHPMRKLGFQFEFEANQHFIREARRALRGK